MQIAIDAVNNLHPLADGYTLNPTWYMPGCNDAESLKAVVKASLARLLVSHVHIPKKQTFILYYNQSLFHKRYKFTIVVAVNIPKMVKLVYILI